MARDPRQRYCPVCGSVDTDPRHQIAGTVDGIAPHMDCCAESGCPDGTCDLLVEGKGRKTGDAFREVIAEHSRKGTVAKAAERGKLRAFTLDQVDQGVHGGLAAGGGPTQLIPTQDGAGT